MTGQNRVHVLGLGSIGTFAAHSLAEIPELSITLLLHRASLLDSYVRNGSRISLKTIEGDVVSHSKYNFEILREGSWYLPFSTEPATGSMVTEEIENLIVCVKATQTVEALRPLKQRLTRNSTILFLQNGSGMIDDANRQLFVDPQTRPKYIIGVISHGVSLNEPFNITHTGFAATSLGAVLRSSGTDEDALDNGGKDYMLEKLPLVPRFNAKSYSFTDVLQIQLEKLAVNAFCNPLCALNDAKNGFLFTIPDTRKAILSEISNVVRALPELQTVPGVGERFSVGRLEETVNAIINKTFETTCSMVWDLRAGRKTEIQFINGYWSRRGREVGIATPINDSLVEQITHREAQRRQMQQEGECLLTL
ncbi:ketopantoate reductase PanE/ApbA-domain-containing protein [Lipomyces orientalis]|uniref:Ketopantoate reductase PanE/ApbA-domain-containing protein n=1 Tax=Lipomyces orientalis TaxID=1233043 RepID=A0ACC3TLV5_9ASCO